MLVGMIEGHTRVIGKRQGYKGLPLRDVMITCEPAGGEVPAMISAWHPTPEELAKLNAGGAVHLVLLGKAHPPVQIIVGDPPRG